MVAIGFNPLRADAVLSASDPESSETFSSLVRKLKLFGESPIESRIKRLEPARMRFLQISTEQADDEGFRILDSELATQAPKTDLSIVNSSFVCCEHF
jgi:hypothetical protein